MRFHLLLAVGASLISTSLAQELDLKIRGDLGDVLAETGPDELVPVTIVMENYVRTSELNDLAAKHPERVKAMAAQWFDIAKNTERLKGRHLSPVKDEIKQLGFRKDTSNQLKK